MLFCHSSHLICTFTLSCVNKVHVLTFQSADTVMNLTLSNCYLAVVHDRPTATVKPYAYVNEKENVAKTFADL